MLRTRLTYANVMATLALFVALGGTAYAVDTVRSSDIVDNEVYSADVRNDNLAGGGLTSGDIANGSMTTLEIRDDNQAFGGLGSQDLGPGSVGSSEVANGTLNDEDISQGSFVNFLASIKSVAAHNCGYNTVTGVNAAGDHLVLTPSFDASPGIINYTAEYAADGTVRIKACNPTDFAYGAHTTRFNLLVIDAQ